jgi:hypothetical protein
MDREGVPAWWLEQIRATIAEAVSDLSSGSIVSSRKLGGASAG